ncbi:MAG: arginine--tRNA ligase [Parvularculaceae bacterium]|nr:arginine--tRNA ligase [Parvularculaceae bacterium]
MTLTAELSALVGEAFAAEGFDKAAGAVRVSDRPDLAQFQCNGALGAAKAAGRNPRELGEKIAARLKADPLFGKVDVAGPGFINLTLTDEALSRRVNAGAGGWRADNPETIVIDYGGPNIAKPLHVGHLRSAIIGECLKRLFRASGHTVIGDIHMGDWGLPMGQLITEIAREQPSLAYFDAAFTGPYPEQSPVSLEDLERLYPQASAACKADPARAAEARQATAELQAGRAGYRALWKHFLAVSRASIEREYADLGVTFDWWKGEADVDPLIAPMVEKLRAEGLAEVDDGAEIIRLGRPGDKKELPPLILYKSDGAVMYGTTDLATILDRRDTAHPDRIFYVVDGRQRDHFEQVFRASGKAGIFPEDRLEHLWFGTMNGKDGKPFKTRAGGVLKLRELIDMVDEKAAARLTETGLAEGYGPDETTAIARKVGVAALKFADLSNPRTSDYIFDIDRFTAFEGKTGPYMLYASVRARSILRKAAEAGAGAPGDIAMAAAEERALVLMLLQYADAVKDACDRRLPHFLCDHAFRLAQSFSSFYAACRIVDEADARVRASRLGLVAAFVGQLDDILNILGMPAPERM